MRHDILLDSNISSIQRPKFIGFALLTITSEKDAVLN